jgi:hypothetical protein
MGYEKRFQGLEGFADPDQGLEDFLLAMIA